MASEIKRRFNRHRNADCQRNRPAGAADPSGYQVKRIGRYYTTAEMDSLRIKDRRTWFRYSQGIGGDAITFLQHFCNQSFPEAVEYLLTFQGRPRDAPVKTKPVTKQDKPPKEFALPPRNADDRRVFAYLRKRGIAAQVIRQFMNSGSLYEDAVHHNCVFVGRDHTGQADMQVCAAPMTATGKGFAEMYPAVTKTSASLSLAILFPTKSESLKRYRPYELLHPPPKLLQCSRLVRAV